MYISFHKGEQVSFGGSHRYKIGEGVKNPR